MSRYDPLGAFLERQPAERVLISFGEIEGILGGPVAAFEAVPSVVEQQPIEQSDDEGLAGSRLYH